MNTNHFVKIHGLGNEYLVLNSRNTTFKLEEKAIKRICNVNFGIGSDGVLLLVESDMADIGLRIFNPDGSEAEKSGNGLRIFCKYVFDYGIVTKQEFSVETKGGIVKAKIEETVNNRAKIITVDMGHAIFQSKLIPANFESAEVVNELIHADDRTYEVNCVSMGNPHCVILKDELNIEEIKHYGPFLENHKMFPNRINVQFAKVINRKEVEILIWERGAGFTLASGTSSCAVASVLRKKNLVDQDITIRMLGGKLTINVDDNFAIRMTGEVREICSGILSPELIEDFHA
ncbi:diaminopimelate epimerase [Paraflavitalea sp. CAU 1676]|uniref:diaminopimelate epimerase n=1 Tax=Paraflavitalea sp. CAU 1676 TaxID=3032598 RepID=UPI0023DA2820|nr:diaminopimelate epimerase [Paraflavitalea sp. CAU 1676]MDF2187593.1 diaminopimelate epimerase [Paraflavitalea sp. CAU 1676]